VGVEVIIHYSYDTVKIIMMAEDDEIFVYTGGEQVVMAANNRR
jgi:hypothetical protein